MASVPRGAKAGDIIVVPVNGGKANVRVPFGVSAGQPFRFRASEIIPDNIPASKQNNYHYMINFEFIL